MTRFNILLLLPLLACRGDAETGIDRTFIRGTVELSPGAYAEESDKGNDAWDGAQDIGYIGSRYTIIDGTCSNFSQSSTPGGTVADGDYDHYSFTPLEDSTLTFSLVYDDADLEAADTGDIPTEKVTWYVAVYDLDDLTYTYSVDKKTKKKTLESVDPALVTEGFSEGSYGNYSFSADVVGGTNYAVVVAGMRSASDSDAYSLLIDGTDPNETTFMIGAYTGSTFAEKGNPVGGSDVPEFTLDPETYTWSGDYEITYVYASTECPRDDQACVDASEPTSVYEYDQDPNADTGTEPFPTITIKADLSEVHLFAGNFASLNAGLTSGTLYSSTPVTVPLSNAVNEDLPDGNIGTNSTNRGVDADTVACDTIQPKLYGWSTDEEEPNNVEWDKDGVITVPAQEMPVGTGNGYVDVINATLDYEIDDPAYGQDEFDAFKVTVPESSAAFISTSWADPNYNIDVYVADAMGTTIAAGWSIADVNPEAFNTLSDFGFTMEPGEEYYILVYAWSGPAGPIDYTIELEWLTP